MIFYRHFRALVDSIVLDMELQAVKWWKWCTATAPDPGRP